MYTWWKGPKEESYHGSGEPSAPYTNGRASSVVVPIMSGTGEARLRFSKHAIG